MTLDPTNREATDSLVGPGVLTSALGHDPATPIANLLEASLASTLVTVGAASVLRSADATILVTRPR